MFGKTHKHYGYYTCAPKPDLFGKPEEYADHTRSVYVREALLECLESSSTNGVFGPDRTTLLRQQLRGHAFGDCHDIEQRITSVNANPARSPAATNSPTRGPSGYVTGSANSSSNAELDTLRQQAVRQQPDLIHEPARLALHLTAAPDTLRDQPPCGRLQPKNPPLCFRPHRGGGHSAKPHCMGTPSYPCSTCPRQDSNLRHPL